jgi:hypothetical protein
MPALRLLRAPAGAQDPGRRETRPCSPGQGPVPHIPRGGTASRLAPQQVRRKLAPPGRQAPPKAMHIELHVVPDCPNGAAAAELITAAVTQTRVRATVTRLVLARFDQAQRRGFVDLPDGPVSWLRPVRAVGWRWPAGATPPRTGWRGDPTWPDLRQASKRAAAR